MIDENVFLKRVKMTGPRAPWMKDLQINELQKKKNQLQYKAHQSRKTKTWTEFRKITNELKAEIKKIKTFFNQNILSSKCP